MDSQLIFEIMKSGGSRNRRIDRGVINVTCTQTLLRFKHLWFAKKKSLHLWVPNTDPLLHPKFHASVRVYVLVQPLSSRLGDFGVILIEAMTDYTHLIRMVLWSFRNTLKKKNWSDYVFLRKILKNLDYQYMWWNFEHFVTKIFISRKEHSIVHTLLKTRKDKQRLFCFFFKN